MYKDYTSLSVLELNHMLTVVINRLIELDDCVLCCLDFKDFRCQKEDLCKNLLYKGILCKANQYFNKNL